MPRPTIINPQDYTGDTHTLARAIHELQKATGLPHHVSEDFTPEDGEPASSSKKKPGGKR